MSAILEETIEVKIETSIVIRNNKLDFDQCQTDDELRAGAERVLTSISAEDLRSIILFTDSKTKYLYTDNNGVTVELK
tara:strand:- start:4176 stop:4409 length:234 start_codon:yes stop_codon:yes gene_type:complete